MTTTNRTDTTYEWWMGEFEQWWWLNRTSLVPDVVPNDMQESFKRLAEQAWRAALDICGP